MRKISHIGMMLLCASGFIPLHSWNMASVRAAEKTTNPLFIDIGTGGPTGVYFVIGQAFCRLVKKQAVLARKTGYAGRPLSCVAPATGGSIDNIRQIARGELDFGIAQSDVQYEAYHGIGKFQTQSIPDLRAVMALHIEPFHLVVSPQSGIETFTDLVDKRVNIGNPTSGHRATMTRLMDRYGLTKEDFSLAAQLNSSEQSQALCDGKIDAFAYAVGVPNGGIALATDVCQARLLTLDGTKETSLVRDHPYYSVFSIPQGTYATLSDPVTTFGARATLVTRASLNADIVYDLTRIIMQNLDFLRRLHPALKDLDPADMIADTLSAPLHPGALRYYQEQGWLTDSAPLTTKTNTQINR